MSSPLGIKHVVSLFVYWTGLEDMKMSDGIQAV